MAKLNVLRTDTKKVTNGVWVDYTCGIRLLIAGIRNSRYKAALESILKPHMNRIHNGLMGPEERLNLIKPAVARFILLGWENVDGEDGKPLPYSYQEALKVFSDPQMEEFYHFVIETATTAETYRVQELETAKENL